MNRIAIAVSALLLTAAGASAADLAPRTYTKAPVMMADPAYNWSGFYLGGNIGYSDRRFDFGWSNPSPPGLPPYPVSNSGGIYGGQAGAQVQWQNVVFGIEYAYNDHFGRRQLDNLGCGGNGGDCALFTNAVQTLGGKLGWAGVNNWLFYVSGGWAWTRASASQIGFDYTNPQTLNGAYAGAGFDYVVWKGGWADLIAGAEYQHIWLPRALEPSSVDGFNPAGINGRYVGRGNEDIVRAKLSLKFNPFGGPVTAKY